MLSRANPGPRCFACEKQHADFEVEGVAAELKAAELKAEEQKAAKHRQKEKPSRSEGYEPEVSRAWAIRERRRASVRTCERGLQSAIASEDVRLTRRWSRSLREAQARLQWAEADLGRQRREPTRSRGGRKQTQRRPGLQALFTRLRGRGILRTSPFGHSRKLNFRFPEFYEVRTAPALCGRASYVKYRRCNLILTYEALRQHTLSR
jgi:hypothetical protein